MDRFVGIPVVFILGIFSKIKKQYRPSKEVNSPLRIGFLKMAAIGDTVLLSACVRDVLERSPGSEITLFLGNTNKEVATLFPDKCRVETIGVSRFIETVKTIRSSGPYDFFFDFDQWDRVSAILAFVSKSRKTVGFKTRSQYRHYAYDYAVEHSEAVHEMENYKSLLRCVGLASNNLPSLVIRGRLVPKSKTKYAVFHMFPGGSNVSIKQWPTEKWIEVARFLLGNGFELYLTGGFQDRIAAEQLVYTNQLSGAVNVVAGTLNIQETAALLSNADVVVSVNTGIMHLASALNCRLIALHGPTNPRRWGPLNPSSITIEGNKTRGPYLNLGFEYSPEMENYMGSISPAEVILSIGKLVTQAEVEHEMIGEDIPSGH